MDPINPFSSEFCLFARCLVFRILEASCCHMLTPLKLYYRFVVCFLCQKGPITERIFSWSGTAQVLNRSYGRRGVFSQMASGNGRESQDDLPNQSNVIAAGCLDDFHMRALGSLYIGSRYVVFYLSISVCGNKQFAILIQFFNCLLRLLRFFFLGCKGNVEKWSMFQLYRVRWCLNARGQAFIGDYVSEHLQFCFRVRFPVAMWDPRFIYANLCMNQGMFASKEETLQRK